MPLYEYRCAQCGRRFEVLQRVGADHDGVACPQCGSVEVSKQLSTFAASVGGVPAPCGAPSSRECGTGGFT